MSNRTAQSKSSSRQTSSEAKSPWGIHVLAFTGIDESSRTPHNDEALAIVNLSLAGEGIPLRESQRPLAGLLIASPVAASVLDGITGVRLVPVEGGHALVSLDEGVTLATVELHLRDLLEATAKGPEREHAIIESVTGLLRRIRRSRKLNIVPTPLLLVETGVAGRRTTKAHAGPHVKERS